ncbi:MAG: sigma-70 family RNA polymerase sigma factor [Acidobacteriota bacterium]
MVSPQDSVGSRKRDDEWVDCIKRVALGEQAALATLYDGTSRVAYGLILRIVGDPSTAEEVTLDVYTQIWRRADSYSEERGAPLAWLLTIARTRALDRLRAGWQDQQRKQPLDVVSHIASGSANPEEETALGERQRLVRGALESLSADQREAIELAYYSGLSHSEIALKLGQPLGTIKTRIRLAMIKLRDQLKPLLEGG